MIYNPYGCRPNLFSRLIIIFILTWNSSPFIFSQSDNFKFTRIDIDKGLSHNQVNCILKDSIGFIWFDTLSGLNRYDGYHFKVFRHNFNDSASINDNYIHLLREDHNGMIWVGTREGFVIYNPEYETFNRDVGSYLHDMDIPAESFLTISPYSSTITNTFKLLLPSRSVQFILIESEKKPNNSMS